MLDQNPYHPLTPPDSPIHFYGREDAIAFIRQHLVGSNNQAAMLIMGRQGMGKTSLLHHAPFMVDERYKAVYIELSPQVMPTLASLVIHLYEVILSRMETIGASTYRIPELPPSNASLEDVLNWFANDFLDVVLTAIHRSRFLLLMLDDFHIVFDAIDAGSIPEDFLNYLHRLMEQHERLDLLVAIDNRYEQRASQHALFSEINAHFRLAHLSPEATRSLIVEPVAEDYQYSDEVIADILKLSGGYPFIVHSICRLLYRYQEGTPQLRVMNPHALESVYLAALEEVDTLMRPYWEAATPNQQHVLMALVDVQKQLTTVSLDVLQKRLERTGSPLNKTQLAATLRSLEYETLIKVNSEGLYSFSSGLEADWIEFNIRPPKAEKRSRLKAGEFSTRLIGAAAVLVALLLLGFILVFGVFDQDGDTVEANPTNAPPTFTLEGVNPDIVQDEATEVPTEDAE